MTQSFGSGNQSAPLTGLLNSAGLVINAVSPFEAESKEIETLKAMVLSRKKHLITKFKSESPNRKKAPSLAEQIELHAILLTDRSIVKAEKDIQKIIDKMVNTKYAQTVGDEVLNGTSKLMGIPSGFL